MSDNLKPLVLAVSQLRAEVIPDDFDPRKKAIRVPLPQGWEVAPWSVADPPSRAVVVGGYRSAAAANADAAAVVAEVAAKMMNAVVRPDKDPPPMRLAAWARIRKA